MPNQAYYPDRAGDQITWLKNYRTKIGNYQASGGYAVPEIIATQADADFLVALLETWQPAVAQYAKSATAYVGLIQNGPTGAAILPIPTFAIVIAAAPVLPGALKRIFAFVKNLKTRPFFTPVVGEDLGVIGASITPNPNAVPTVSAEARSGEVVVRFTKDGHLGVWIEGQVGAETAWSFLAIDTTDPYNDTRPLKVAGQPEKRRYRVCFWDGTPSNVWTAVMEVTYGG